MARAQSPDIGATTSPATTTLAAAAHAEAARLAAQNTIRVERRRNDSVLNGALIGAGIDALIRKREVTYVPAGAATVSVSPVLERRARGVQLAVRF